MQPASELPLDEPLLTASDTAQLLRIHSKTVLLFARAGRLPALRVGRHWRFRKSDLTRWADMQTKQWRL